MQRSIDVSVVVPIYNEEENLPELRRRLVDVLEGLGIRYEIVFANDGSRDSSMQLLRMYAAENPHIKVLEFSRNFGHQAALYAGMRNADGRAVILMDGDLQDPPEVLPRLIEQWKRGFEVVHAIREKRKEGVLKRAAYAIYYRLLKRMAYIDITLDSGDFSLMDRRVVDILAAMPERNKFLRGLRSWVGFKQTSVVYERAGRHAGAPKYTFSKLVKLALDGMISYSYLPPRLTYFFGLIVAAASFALAAIYFLMRVLGHEGIPKGFTTLAILVLFLGGVQLIGLGLLGEYIGRIYDEVKRRPEYVVREAVGVNAELVEAR